MKKTRKRYRSSVKSEQPQPVGNAKPAPGPVARVFTGICIVIVVGVHLTRLFLHAPTEQYEIDPASATEMIQRIQDDQMSDLFETSDFRHLSDQAGHSLASEDTR
ncbi:MAG: hypothetical protein AAF456_01580 [Planctomycetota bacterium]